VEEALGRVGRWPYFGAVVLEPEDAWMDVDTRVEEATHIAQTRSLPTGAFTWWKVDRAVNRADPDANGKELLSPVQESAKQG
jgi:hypothetical protein